MNYKDKISEMLNDYRWFRLSDVSNCVNRNQVRKYLRKLEKEKVIMTLGGGKNTSYLGYSPLIMNLLNR